MYWRTICLLNSPTGKWRNWGKGLQGATLFVNKFLTPIYHGMSHKKQCLYVLFMSCPKYRKRSWRTQMAWGEMWDSAIPQPLFPGEGSFTTCGGRSLLCDPEGKEETREMVELRSETCLSLWPHRPSLLLTLRCDLSSGVRGQFSCPWEKPKHTYLRLHCNVSENDLHLCSVCFEVGKLLGWKSDPDKTPVLRYLPVAV